MPRRLAWLLLALGALAFVKAIATIALVPPFQTPDEYSHYDYAVYLSHVPPGRFVRGDIARWTDLTAPAVTREVWSVAESAGVLDHLAFRQHVGRRVPLAAMVARGRTFVESDTGETLASRASVSPAFVYPPLYHLGLAFVLRAQRAAGVTNPVVRYYVARLTSVALLAVTLVAALRLLDLLTVAPWLRVGIFGLVALHPQLTLLSASVQPDNLAVALTTVASLLIARYYRSGRVGAWIACCAVCGALLLSKPHLAVALFGGAVLVALVRPAPHGPASPFITLGLGALVLLGVGGWWMARSSLVFGNPVGPTAQYEAGVPAGFLSNISTWLTISLPSAFTSYWGMWGWLEYGYPEGVYAVFRVLTILPLPFYVAAWRRTGSLDRRGVLATPDGRLMAFGALAFVVFAMEMVFVAGRFGPGVNNQGRNWLPFVVFEMLYLGGIAAVLRPETSARPAVARERWHVGLHLGAALLVIGLAAHLLMSRPVPPDGFVVVDTSGGARDRIELAYDGGGAFMSWQRARAGEASGEEGVRFGIRTRHVAGLRLEVAPGSSAPALGAGRIEDHEGRSIATLDPGRFRVLSGGTAERGDGVLIVRPDASEPAVVDLGLPAPLALPRSPGRRLRVVAALLAPSVAQWALSGVVALLAYAALVRLAAARPERAVRIGQVYVAGLVGGLGLLDVYLLVATWLRYPVTG